MKKMTYEEALESATGETIEQLRNTPLSARFDAIEAAGGTINLVNMNAPNSDKTYNRHGIEVVSEKKLNEKMKRAMKNIDEFLKE